MLMLRNGTGSLFDHLFALNREFDTGLPRWAAAERLAAWTPAAEVQETDEQIRLHVELPGVNPDDVNLMVQNGVLTISGQKNAASAEAEGTVRYNERWYGRFERTFTLPTSVHPDRIEASYQNGVLTVQLYKTEQARARRIPISFGVNARQGRIGSGQN